MTRLAFFGVLLFLVLFAAAMHFHGKDQQGRGVVESVVLHDAYGKCWRVENNMYVPAECRSAVRGEVR